MVRFPTAPDTLVTLQIQCVSCNELFTLAEDEANASTREAWRMPPNGSGRTEMHQPPQHTHHLVRPLTRSTPELDDDNWEQWEDKTETAVNCPRCGTDNRNWLRISYAPHPGNWFERLWERINRFWLTWISVIVTIFLLLRLLIREWDNTHLITYALMFTIIILGTVIPITAITGMWRQERLHKISAQFDETQSAFKKISPSIMQAVTYFGIFVLAIPFVVYILLPWMTGTFQNEKPLVARIDQALIELDAAAIQELENTSPNELEPAKNAVASIQSWMPNNLFLCNLTTIDNTLAKLNGMDAQNSNGETAVLISNATYYLEQLKNQANNGTCDPQTVTNAIMPLSKLYTDEWQKCAAMSSAEQASDPVCSNPAVVSMIEHLQTAGDPGALFIGDLTASIRYTLKEARALVQQTDNQEMIARIEGDVTTLEKAINRANDGPDTLPGTANMLNTWLKYVGLSCLLAVITAVFATKIHIGKVNRHLPQPLCYSLSRLTRVVLWEARHTLETKDHFTHIDWDKAYRNRYGGITLQGLLFPPTNSQPDSKRIRAIRYTLTSDLWGHILFAESKSVRVPPSVFKEWQDHQRTAQTTDNYNELFVNAEANR